MPGWPLSVLVTAGVLTTTTTTITSTVAMPAASAGPVYPSYSGQAPSLGLASVRPVRATAGGGCFQLASIQWRSVWRSGLVQMAGMPNSETTALGLLRMVLQVSPRASGQLPAMTSGASSMELEPSLRCLVCRSWSSAASCSTESSTGVDAGTFRVPVEPVATRRVVINAWMAAVCASDSRSPARLERVWLD